MKGLKISISIFISLFLISVIPLNNTVSAYIIDNNTSFEDGTISQNYTNSFVNTHSSGTTMFYVDNLNPRTGSKDFVLKGISTSIYEYMGYWNFTYSPSQYMHQFELYAELTGGQSSQISLSFRDDADEEIIFIRLNYMYGGQPWRMYYKNYIGSEILIAESDVGYHHFGFSFQSNDTVTYWSDSTIVSSTPANITIGPDARITDMIVYKYQAYTPYYSYFDDLRVIIADTVSGGGVTPSTFPSCSGSEIGQLIYTSDTVGLPKSLHTTGVYQYVTQVYKVVSTFNITDYRIILDNIYYMSYYQTIQLKINSYDLGYPTDIDDRGSTLILSWENLSGVRIEGEFVYMCFKFPIDLTKPFSPDDKIPYYFRTVTTFDKTSNDIDNDGFTRLVVHADINYWNNFCNSHNYRDNGILIHDGLSPITEYYDLDYSFCYEYQQSLEIGSYTNDIWVTPSSVSIPNKVTVGYTISQSGFMLTNYIVINNSGVEYYNETTDIYQQASSFDFRVMQTGVYNVSLYQNSVKIKTVQFTGTGGLNNAYNWIYTDLATVIPSRTFNIYYNYVATNFEGVITYTKCGGSQIEITKVNKSSNGIISYSILDEGLYSIILNVNPSEGNYYQLNSTTILVVGTHINKIDVSDYIVIIPKTITIFGEHAFTGSDVYVYKNGVFFGSVGCEPRYSFYDTLDKSGTFKYTLVVKHGSVTTILDTINVTAAGTSTIDDNGGFDSMKYISNLPIPVKIGIGLFLTLIITLLPLIIGIILSKHSITMPNMIYVGFFFLGMGVSCGLGFLNWALFFVILLGLIIYYALQYQSSKTG